MTRMAACLAVAGSVAALACDDTADPFQLDYDELSAFAYPAVIQVGDTAFIALDGIDAAGDTTAIDEWAECVAIEGVASLIDDECRVIGTSFGRATITVTVPGGPTTSAEVTVVPRGFIAIGDVDSTHVFSMDGALVTSYRGEKPVTRPGTSTVVTTRFGNLQMFDVATGTSTTVDVPGIYVDELAYSGDGSRLFLESSGTLYRADPDGSDPEPLNDDGAYFEGRSIVASDDGSLIAGAIDMYDLDQSGIEIFEAATGERDTVVTLNDGRPAELAWRPGTMEVSWIYLPGSGSLTLFNTDVTSGEEVALPAPGGAPDAVAWAPDGRHAAVLWRSSTTLELIDVETGEHVLVALERHPQAWAGMAWIAGE